MARTTNEVVCRIFAELVPNARGLYARGLLARCAKCGRAAWSFEIGPESERLCLAISHKTCPHGESNFYVSGHRPSEYDTSTPRPRRRRATRHAEPAATRRAVRPDPFGILARAAPTDALKALYRATITAAHPDRGGRHETAQEVNAAWERVKKSRGLR